MMVAILTAMTILTGCKTAEKGFFGIVKGVVIQDDYKAAGYRVGKAAYMGYVIMKGDPKYDKYTKKAEEIYAALDNAQDFDTKSVNQTALEILQAALTARYGYVKAALITDGVRIGGVVADRFIVKNVSSTDADLYIKGLKEGIDDARAEVPQSALDEAAAKAAEKAAKEKAKKDAEKAGKEYQELPKGRLYITCKDGHCKYDFLATRDLTKQLAIARELKEYGFVKETEQRKEQYTHTNYENVCDFIDRLENLEKFGVKKLRLWIAEVEVTCNGDDCVLDRIKFVLEDDNGGIREETCVSCVTDLELIDIWNKELENQ